MAEETAGDEALLKGLPGFRLDLAPHRTDHDSNRAFLLDDLPGIDVRVKVLVGVLLLGDQDKEFLFPGLQVFHRLMLLFPAPVKEILSLLIAGLPGIGNTPPHCFEPFLSVEQLVLDGLDRRAGLRVTLHDVKSLLHDK